MGFRFWKSGGGDEDGGEATTGEEASAVRQVTTESELLEAIGDGPGLIYKHSFRCGLCFRSQREVERFAARRPDVPVVMIDVVADRALSNRVAESLGVFHHSPQAIVVREGEAVWDASHLGVTAGAIEAAVA